MRRKCNHENTKGRTRTGRKPFLRVFVSSWPTSVSPRPATSVSALQGEKERLLERLGDPAQEADTVGAVDHSMIVGQRKRQHQPGHEPPIVMAGGRGPMALEHRLHGCA